MYAAIAQFCVWLFVFLCIYNGVNSASYVVWITVPIPICFIIIMVFHGLTLEGSQDGIRDYLQGDEAVKEKVDNIRMWADAIG